MKKTIRLTESELKQLIVNVINETYQTPKRRVNEGLTYHKLGQLLTTGSDEHDLDEGVEAVAGDVANKVASDATGNASGNFLGSVSGDVMQGVQSGDINMETAKKFMKYMKNYNFMNPLANIKNYVEFFKSLNPTERKCLIEIALKYGLKLPIK